jgi:hypothetical protein
MARAFAGVSYVDWPFPKNPVDWLPFDGQYAFHGAPAEPKEKKKEDKTSTSSPTTTTAPPPPTTAPPPPTTTAPPPTTTGT